MTGYRTTLALAAVAALSLTGCASQTASTAQATTATNAITSAEAVAATSSAPASTEAASPATSASPSDPASSGEASSSEAPSDETSSGVQKFGSTVKFPDGVSMTISKPTRFIPSDTATVSMQKKNAASYLAFEVTLVNGSSKPYEPSMVFITGQSGDQEAERVFDSAKGVEGEPSTKLMPGRQAKWKVVFGLIKANDLVLEVRPGFDYESVMYQL